MHQSKTPASAMALGGVLAALSVCIMALGGLIPVATYVIPMLCMILLQFVRSICGNRVGWAWYGAVCILGLLLGPDKEAQAVFLALGYYPLIKPRFDRSKAAPLYKALYFNAVILSLYWLLLNLMGLPGLVKDFEGMTILSLAILLALGNFCFFTMDRILGKPLRRLGRGR